MYLLVSSITSSYNQVMFSLKLKLVYIADHLVCFSDRKHQLVWIQGISDHHYNNIKHKATHTTTYCIVQNIGGGKPYVIVGLYCQRRLDLKASEYAETTSRSDISNYNLCHIRHWRITSDSPNFSLPNICTIQHMQWIHWTIDTQA